MKSTSCEIGQFGMRLCSVADHETSVALLSTRYFSRTMPPMTAILALEKSSIPWRMLITSEAALSRALNSVIVLRSRNLQQKTRNASRNGITGGYLRNISLNEIARRTAIVTKRLRLESGKVASEHSCPPIRSASRPSRRHSWQVSALNAGRFEDPVTNRQGTRRPM